MTALVFWVAGTSPAMTDLGSLSQPGAALYSAPTDDRDFILWA